MQCSDLTLHGRVDQEVYCIRHARNKLDEKLLVSYDWHDMPRGQCWFIIYSMHQQLQVEQLLANIIQIFGTKRV
jgi:hypothetical protein